MTWRFGNDSQGKSLDDWMREVWHQHPDIEKPYTLPDLQSALGVAVGDRTFADEMFRRYIFGKEAMPYGNLLAPAGMLLRKAHAGEAWWGRPELTDGEDGVTLKNETYKGTPLYKAGLGRNDRILTVDRTKVKTSADVKNVLTECKPGEVVHVEVAGRAGTRKFGVRLAEDPQWEIVTFEKADREVSPQIEAFRKAWLSSKAIHPLPDIN